MSLELTSLVVLTLFFFLAWLPGSLAKRQVYGREYLLSNRDQTALPPLPVWGERATRAYENLKGYFPAFAVAVLTLAHLRISDPWTQGACLVFVLARLAHFVFYTSGVAAGRASAWVVSMLANLYLLGRLLVVLVLT